jgi:hypothetical protein
VPCITRSHDDLALIASGLRQTLLADELLGLYAAEYGLAVEVRPLSGELRAVLAELARDLEAVAQEHAPPAGEPRVERDAGSVIAFVDRLIERSGSLAELEVRWVAAKALGEAMRS